MSAAVKALEGASRRALQGLAKELQLCKGNAKSDVILGHAMEFLDSNPKDGEQQVLDALSGDSPTPQKSPKPKKEKASPKATKEEATVAVKENETTVVVKEKKSKKQQPEDEPTVSVTSVEVVETPTKKSEETKKVTPKDKKKAKQAAVKSPKESVKVASSKSPNATVKASPVTKKSPTSKSKPSDNDEKKQVASKKEKSPIAKKAKSPIAKKLTPRKALEALVKSTPSLSFVGEARVRCSTTGHEMMADVDVVNKYINGKRYQKAHNRTLSFAKYAPMFVNHSDESKTEMLWCNVTESAIPRDVERVEAHIAAHKYQNQLPIWKEQEAAKKKAEEEEAQRRAVRIEIARKRRLAAEEEGDAADKKRFTKRAKKTVDSGRKK